VGTEARILEGLTMPTDAERREEAGSEFVEPLDSGSHINIAMKQTPAARR
jgi:hypothetical protein